MSKLEELRKAIDELDDRILELLNARAALAIEVGRIKKRNNTELHVPSREKAITERLTANNPGPFPNESLKVILREIFSASLSLEKPLKAAYMGPEASFSHLAAMQQFGNSATLVPVNSIKEVFAEVERGLADYGVVPIENSIEGIIGQTLDLLMESPLRISAEMMVPVRLNLMNRTGDVSDVKGIYSHPQPLAQSRNWLESNMKGVPVFDVSSTTKAAKMAAADKSVAAVASALAAELYGLRVIKGRIEDNVNNYTRFLVVARSSPLRSGQDKTSILFSVKDAPGALYRMLRPFAKRGINLTKIESRPSRKKPWEYHFFVDMLGHAEDAPVSEAIEELGKSCIFLKVLGSYPVAEGLPAE
jgi:chorismate mutase / prephenate dehydratase